MADPYRWLEDGDSPHTRSWAAAQDARTRAVLDGLPQRAELHPRLLSLLQAGTAGGAQMAGDRLFTLEREGDDDQARLVLRSVDDSTVSPRVVVDPHGLTADHAAAIDWYSASPDGRLVAYGVSEAGSEHGTLRIVDVDRGTVLPDALGPTRHPSVSWLPDGSAFSYSRLPDPSTVAPGEEGYWERLFWHRLGDDQADDEPLLGDDLERTALPASTISPDGRWLAIHVHYMPTRTDVFLLDRQSGKRTMVVEGEEATTWVRVVGDRLYGVTNLGAPRGRVISASVDDAAVGNWTTIVPESSAVIESAALAGDSLLVSSTEHAASRLHRWPVGGASGGDTPQEIALPDLGSIGGIDAEPDRAPAFFTFTSFARPAGVWKWSPEAGLQPWVVFPTPVDPVAIAVEQRFYPSTDGASVPIFLVRSASTTPGPDTPTTLGGYGGFAISSSPAFSPGLVAFAEAGGLGAVACIRGGGEYGEDWHRAGMLGRKQQVFDDFAAAAEWLVAQKLTSPHRLAIRGGSNGGLLVGATLTQRPDLCRAVVCAVPLLDMLRYHRALIGALWVPEYGDPERAEEFAWLHAYSPYHRVVNGLEYPAVLITTAESDSRVDPMHARKFAARLQAATASPDADRPVLLRVESRAGHGVGKPTWKQADELADAWAFLFWQLRVGA